MKNAQKTKKEKKVSLKTRILCLVFLPLIGLAIVMAIVAANGANNLTKIELQETLSATTSAVREIFNGHEGQYYLDANGQAFKGDFNISECNNLLDEIKKDSGCEITFFFGDTRMVTTVTNPDGKRAVGTKVTDQRVIDTVLGKGQGLFNENLLVQGTRCYVYYQPVFQEGTNEVIGMTFAGLPRTTVEQGIANVVVMIIFFSILVIVGSGISTVVNTNKISKIVNYASDSASAIADGNMTIQVHESGLKRTDEIGDISRTLEDMRKTLGKSIGDVLYQSSVIKDTSDQLNTTADEANRAIAQVDAAINDIAAGASSQADDTTRASGEVERIGALIEKTADNVTKMADISKNMADESAKTASTFAELNSITGKVTEEIALIREQINMTNSSALKIREATEAISSIASQTNLLSLNASIEAARAGEAGRGFAVVASEIQHLAEQSNESSSEIDQIVNALLADAEKSVEVMEEVSEIILKQTEGLASVSEAFDKVKEGINENERSIKNIASDTETLNQARVQVLDTISNLTAIAEENAASTEETSAATNQVNQAINDVTTASVKLAEIINKLEDELSKYTIG